ncbi:TPA: hypothetical protein U1199_000222 [Streptococcus suis]|nr:hypothetical protein [Streptococcus suis]HEL2324614.1 hypothetical protein [Streptococcus suis]HEM5030133.1 hypothetical protein [Streptococcus suis]HEM5047067.1 hypothetical protein [Streptococcus suis]HEM5056207.1 hypothetical protein [Streptococcus suis]
MDSNIIITKQEALNRLQQMEERFQERMNPNIRKYFDEGKLYYSYITGNGLIGSIDTISYDPNYERVVQEFEEKRNKLVYHVIETGSSIALLYVSLPSSDLNGEELEWEWEEERLAEDNSLLAYVHNFVESSFSETGYITIDTFADSGALIRIF